MLFDKIKPYLTRVLFVLLSSAIMVFFSEKTFWYIQGYAIFELMLFYSIPVAASIWVIDHFQVQRLSGVVLVGGLFGFLVEGILTPVIYEAGLLDPIMPAYFVGWHGLLSVVFGWYLLRKWLVEGNWKKLAISSFLFGSYWGVWSLTYRLPESIQEFEGYVQAGESWLPGAWPTLDFAFFTFVFTGMLMIGHLLLGQGLWQSRFSLRKWEIGLLVLIMVFIYAFQVFPIVPLGFLKLAGLILLVIIPLNIQKKYQIDGRILESLAGRIQFSQTMPLLVIPLTASFVYRLAAFFPPPENLLRLSFQSIYTVQGLIGGAFFIWAWVDSIRTCSAVSPTYRASSADHAINTPTHEETEEQGD